VTDDFTEPEEGFVCVALAGPKIEELIALLKQGGLAAKTESEGCGISDDLVLKDSYLITFAAGFERWVIEKLRNVRGVTYVD
jgi:hypothetical protein